MIRGRREHQLTDRIDEFLNCSIVVFEPVFKLHQLCHNLPVCGQSFTHAYERSDYKDAL